MNLDKESCVAALVATIRANRAKQVQELRKQARALRVAVGKQKPNVVEVD